VSEEDIEERSEQPAHSVGCGVQQAENVGSFQAYGGYSLRRL
jgi:hypothetical protein